MAGQTIIHCLSLGVGLMALETLGNQAVGMMTEGTGLLGVHTGILFELLSLLFMTGQTGTGYVIGQGQVQRLVRIGMAGQAVLKLEMRSAAVTFGTLRDDIFAPWRMLLMTVKAGYGGAMLAAAGAYGGRLLLVTFDTVGRRKRRRFFSKGRKS